MKQTRIEKCRANGMRTGKGVKMDNDQILAFLFLCAALLFLIGFILSCVYGYVAGACAFGFPLGCQAIYLWIDGAFD